MSSSSDLNGAGVVVTSPCIKICRLDDQGWCVGCRRSMEEISGWPKMSSAQKLAVLAELPTRDGGI